MGQINCRALVHYSLTVDQSCSTELSKTHIDFFKKTIKKYVSSKKLLVTSTLLGHLWESGTVYRSLLHPQQLEQCWLQSPAWQWEVGVGTQRIRWCPTP